MPGDSGVLVVARVRSTNTKCTRGRGCSGHPAFPTPSKGAEDKCTARAHRAAGARTCIWNWKLGDGLRAMAQRGAPRSQPSSPANAGDPVFRGVNDGVEMSTLVMPGLDPGIHLSSQDHFRRRWIAGSSPAMTDGRREHSTCSPHNSLALLNANEDTRLVFSSRISVRVIGGSARWLQFSRSQSRQLTPIGVPSVFSRSIPVA
jgi:hypothetical protein